MRRPRPAGGRADPAVIVIAKSPLLGRAKTRLCPPLSTAEAAGLAEAALVDTLEAVRGTPRVRRVLALDGPPGAWLRPGIVVIPQRGAGLAERIASAFADVGGPALLIGMDTPQVTPSLLAGALATAGDSSVDAVLGLAEDGGWWGAGLKRVHPEAFAGVPMSTPRTGHAQLTRLRALGMRVALLPPLRDVDTIADAYAVAAEAPDTRFAATLAQLLTPTGDRRAG